MSLSFIALQCAQLLAQAQAKQTLGPIHRAIEDTLVRFKIWAGNVGIFAPENASVDYRLRQDEEIVAVLTSILTSLKNHLEKAVSTTILEEPEDAVDAAARTSQSSSTSSESSCSISLDSDVSESALVSRPTGMGSSSPADAMAKANNEIDRLYRLASVLRKPVSSTENTRVHDFIAKKMAAGETEDMDDAEDHARSHLQARFPNAAPFLASRLVAAVVLRRMQLRYRERHQGKLQQGVEQSFVPGARRATLAMDSQKSRVAAQALRPLTLNRPETPLGFVKTGQSLVWSATNASSVDRARYARYAESAALSRITQSAVARRLKLDVPRPPKELDERLRKVNCSFCMKLISKEETQEPRWTRHVLKDIKPYVCLFPGCSHGDALFSSVEEWLVHLQWQHTIMWACQVAGHEDHIFSSEKELEQHIIHSHPRSFADGQLPDLVSQGARPAADTFAMLAMLVDSEGGADTPLANPCPICKNFQPTQPRPDEVDSQATGDIQAHILEHLETIALLSLPGKENDDAAGSNVKQSNQSSTEEDLATLELWSLSTASDTDIDTDAASDQDSVHQQDKDLYVPLEDDQHWQEICRLVKRDFPKPEDDPILLLWHQRTAYKSSFGRFWSPVGRQVGRWLFPSRVTEGEGSRVERIKGSADWFLAREDVQKWCSGTPECRILWLRGARGCGKTVLTGAVLEHLLTKENRFTLYFSFSVLSPERRTLDEMVRTLILQLCKLNDRAEEHLATLFQPDQDRGHQPTLEYLIHLLQSMLKTEGCIHIIMDVLDESSPDCEATVDWLKTLFSAPDLSQLRVLLVSDVAPIWSSALEDFVDCNIGFKSQAVEAAMYRLIEARFRDESVQSGIRLSRELLDQMSTKIIDTAAMNFRTAKGMLENLATLTKQAEIEEALRNLQNPDIQKRYSAYFKSIPKAVEGDSMRLLQFIIHGERHLTDLEVGEVLATREGKSYPNGILAGFDLADFFPQPVTTIISADHRGYVHLSDPAIRVFVLSKPAFDPDQANKAILRTCLTYLSNLAKTLDKNTTTTMEEVDKLFPLTLYIVPHLMKHAHESGFDVEAVQALVDFFEDRATFMIWKCLHEHNWPPSHHSTEFGSPLLQACSAGLSSVVQRLIERGANVNRDYPDKLRTPLAASARIGHEQIARILLINGADINERGGDNDTALQAACSHGRIGIVQFLLDCGADVNARGGMVGTALQAACCYGYVDIVQLLLDRGADVNAMDDTVGTALQAVCRCGYRDIAQLLLGRGADVNLEGGEYGSALQASAFTKCEDVVSLLLSKGANVNATGGSFGTALQIALSNTDRKDIARLLLDNGADPKFVSGDEESLWCFRYVQEMRSWSASSSPRVPTSTTDTSSAPLSQAHPTETGQEFWGYY